MSSKHAEAVERSRKKHQIVELKLHLSSSEKEAIREYAAKHGKTMEGYIKELIRADMNKT